MKIKEFFQKFTEAARAANVKPNPAKIFSAPIQIRFNDGTDMNYRNMTHLIQDLRAGMNRVDYEITNSDEVIKNLVKELA